MRESAATIDAAASTWVTRIDRGLTEVEQATLEEWLAGDTRRVGALARAQATWLRVERAKVFRGARELGESPIERFRRKAVPCLSAAAMLLGLAIAVWVWQGYTRTHLTTATGEIRQVRLADGSQVTLGTRSRVSLQYESRTRRVRLESGEALFEVAKDANRPFIVQAGNVRVRAIGTAFDVRRRSDRDVEVTVTDGTVDVWRETTNPEPAVRLPAGRRTLVTAQEIAEPEELTAVQLARAVEWKTGMIDFNGRTLAEAAAELNRYNHQTIVIADAALASQRVVGRFQATDPRAFASAAAAMLNAHVRTDGDQLILEPGPSPRK